uniref:Uncharacterized protein n=1 Tax=Adineta vaga TaxID=104782 RepID=B3G4L5_ADIVA|nr:unknown [Adineta vaga]
MVHITRCQKVYIYIYIYMYFFMYLQLSRNVVHFRLSNENVFYILLCFSLKYLEVSIRSTETNIIPTTPSIDITASVDRLHTDLAPLASSETFSDVVSLCHDDQLKKDKKTFNTEKKSNQMNKINDFDSLEILFDFPSVDLSIDSQTDIVHPVETPCRIRFSENTQIINIQKSTSTKITTTFTIRFTSKSNRFTECTMALYVFNEISSLFVAHWFYSSLAKRLSEVLSSPRQSIRNASEGPLKKVLPGVVVTSSRSSRRRISSAAATQAFAVATSGESPKGMRQERLSSGGSVSTQSATTNNSAMVLSPREQRANEYIIVNTASTMRVLNVLRHWLTKHPLVSVNRLSKWNNCTKQKMIC